MRWPVFEKHEFRKTGGLVQSNSSSRIPLPFDSCQSEEYHLCVANEASLQLLCEGKRGAVYPEILSHDYDAWLASRALEEINRNQTFICAL